MIASMYAFVAAFVVSFVAAAEPASDGVWTNPIIVGLVVGAPAVVVGAWQIVRTERKDEAAVEPDVLIESLKYMVKNLRLDNEEGRQRQAELSGRLTECNTAYSELKRLTETPGR